MAGPIFNFRPIPKYEWRKVYPVDLESIYSQLEQIGVACDYAASLHPEGGIKDYISAAAFHAHELAMAIDLHLHPEEDGGK